MRIQLASDLHLEKNPGLGFVHLLKPSADVIVLAGDIGNPLDQSYYDFLRECSCSFRNTLLVAGNHEYRRAMPLTMHEVDMRLQRICNGFGNIHYLAHGQSICLEHVNFIGATMWTPILPRAGFSAEYMHQLDASWSQQQMNEATKWGIAQNNATHEAHLREIEKRVNWGLENKKKNVVITHHSPLLSGPFARKDLPKDYLFGVDLSRHISAPAISAWVFGHTHHNYVGNLQGTIVASNQYGSRGIAGWSPSFTINI